MQDGYSAGPAASGRAPHPIQPQRRAAGGVCAPVGLFAPASCANAGIYAGGGAGEARPRATRAVPAIAWRSVLLAVPASTSVHWPRCSISLARAKARGRPETTQAHARAKSLSHTHKLIHSRTHALTHQDFSLPPLGTSPLNPYDHAMAEAHPLLYLSR